MSDQCNALGPRALHSEPERERGKTRAEHDVNRSEMCRDAEIDDGAQPEVVIRCARDIHRTRFSKRADEGCDSRLDEHADARMDGKAPGKRDGDIDGVGVGTIFPIRAFEVEIGGSSSERELVGKVPDTISRRDREGNACSRAGTEAAVDSLIPGEQALRFDARQEDDGEKERAQFFTQTPSRRLRIAPSRSRRARMRLAVSIVIPTMRARSFRRIGMPMNLPWLTGAP